LRKFVDWENPRTQAALPLDTSMPLHRANLVITFHENSSKISKEIPPNSKEIPPTDRENERNAK